MVPATDEERLWLLQSVPALRSVPSGALMVLLAHLGEGCVPAGHVLVGGSPSSAVVVVIDGLVEACRPTGGRRVLGPGAVLGFVPGCDAPVGAGEIVRAVTAVVAWFLPTARFIAAQAGPGGADGQISGAQRTRGGR